MTKCDCGGEKTRTPHSDWCSSQIKTPVRTGFMGFPQKPVQDETDKNHAQSTIIHSDGNSTIYNLRSFEDFLGFGKS